MKQMIKIRKFSCTEQHHKLKCTADNVSLVLAHFFHRGSDRYIIAKYLPCSFQLTELVEKRACKDSCSDIDWKFTCCDKRFIPHHNLSVRGLQPISLGNLKQ
jgi:hypothetical protein